MRDGARVPVQAKESTGLHQENEMASIRFARRRCKRTENARPALRGEDVLDAPGGPEPLGHCVVCQSRMAIGPAASDRAAIQRLLVLFVVLFRVADRGQLVPELLLDELSDGGAWRFCGCAPL